jgi:hypothetical protein
MMGMQVKSSLFKRRGTQSKRGGTQSCSLTYKNERKNGNNINFGYQAEVVVTKL